MRMSVLGGDRDWKGDVPEMFLDVSKLDRLGWKAHNNSGEAVRSALRTINAGG